MNKAFVGAGDIGIELEDALKAAQRLRQGTFDHWDFSIEAIEYLVTFLSLRAPEDTRNYLLALAGFAATKNERGHHRATKTVLVERENLLITIKRSGRPQ